MTSRLKLHEWLSLMAAGQIPRCAPLGTWSVQKLSWVRARDDRCFGEV